ncbi:hypothetical protein PENCOP_c002G08898 [Penicillium coprophilum]|uniref:Uncharacterized protein n=1 Tax=Penicillium coprophilum TaxID=36646 RepID=A0A1V6V1E4_9EURO|nr:hypothetical protein PENCOP_c002G08898 [Penicillium coprophilum]
MGRREIWDAAGSTMEPALVCCIGYIERCLQEYHIIYDVKDYITVYSILRAATNDGVHADEPYEAWKM